MNHDHSRASAPAAGEPGQRLDTILAAASVSLASGASNHQLSLTATQGFGHVPALGADLFHVVPGLPASTAIRHAQTLLSCVQDRLTEAADGGLGASDAYALAFLVETSIALYAAAGVVE